LEEWLKWQSTCLVSENPEFKPLNPRTTLKKKKGKKTQKPATEIH
jgi:hypothetical protein